MVEGFWFLLLFGADGVGFRVLWVLWVWGGSSRLFGLFLGFATKVSAPWLFGLVLLSPACSSLAASCILQPATPDLTLHFGPLRKRMYHHRWLRCPSRTALEGLRLGFMVEVHGLGLQGFQCSGESDPIRQGSRTQSPILQAPVAENLPVLRQMSTGTRTSRRAYFVCGALNTTLNL